MLDLCPTILTLFGLPPGKDMDGKVLVTAFREPPRVEPIESWDDVPGDAGTHRSEARVDPVASVEAFKQLVELGYVAPPGATVLTPPPVFTRWWAMTEACSGITRDMSAVTWYVTTGSPSSKPERIDTIDVTMPMPALGPSFGVAPSGR